MVDEDLQDREAIQDVVSVLAKHLTTEWSRAKTPKGFDAAWKRARDLPPDSAEKVLFSVGFKAWLPYFLANHGNSSHFPGRADTLRVISTLEGLSQERQEEVARKLNDTEAHSTVLAAIENLRKRQQNDRETFKFCGFKDSDLSPGLTKPRHPPRPLPSEMQGNLNPSLQPAQSSIQPAQSSIQPNMISTTAAGTNSETTSLTGGRQDVQTASNPLARRLPDIFPPYMANAIRKTDDKAHIEMGFPYSLGMVCMSLAILPSKVEYIAMEFFGIHVEEEAGFRYIDYGGEARVLIQGEVIFQGARDDAIDKYFGHKMSNDFNESPARMKEIDQGISRTRFVTMQITGNPQEDGFLNISIGEDEAFQVKEILFR